MAQFLNSYILNGLLKAPNFLFGTEWAVGDHYWLGYLLAAAIHIFLLIQVVAVGALVFIWMERKVAGRIQDRLGRPASAVSSAGCKRWPTASS